MNSESILKLKQQISEIMIDMRDQLHVIEKRMENLEEDEKDKVEALSSIEDFGKRIEKLETKISRAIHYINENDKRIEKLEVSMEILFGKLPIDVYKLYNRDMEKRIKQLEALNKQYFDANPLGQINERFEKLENNNITNTKVGMSQFNEVLRRIENLESRVSNKESASTPVTHDQGCFMPTKPKQCEHEWDQCINRYDYSIMHKCRLCGLTQTTESEN